MTRTAVACDVHAPPPSKAHDSSHEQTHTSVGDHLPHGGPRVTILRRQHTHRDPRDLRDGREPRVLANQSQVGGDFILATSEHVQLFSI
jgi:hypothetical protein